MVKKYEYLVVDSYGNKHSLVAGYSVIKGAHLCFYTDTHGYMLHVFFQPLSSLCLGECKND